VKSADFKKIVNSYFKPKIEAIGFKGKDNKFYKKCVGYTAIINFLRYYRYGQGFHVEMLIKLNDIKYPPYFKNFSSGRALKFCEFSKQLAPINVSHWVWPYDNNEENTKLLLDDVLKLLSTKGKEYFDQFKEVKKVLDKIKHSDGNSWDRYYSDIGYPSRFRDFSIGDLHNCYFLFAFYKNVNNKKLAVYYAEKGLDLIKNYADIYIPEAFQESFEAFIN